MDNLFKKIMGTAIALFAAISLVAPAINVMATEPAVSISKVTGNQTVQVGKDVTFKAEVTGGPANFEWSTSIPAKAIEDNGWGQVQTSSDGSSITIKNCTKELDGMIVFCQVNGDTNLTSSKSTLSVTDEVEYVASSKGNPIPNFELASSYADTTTARKATDVYGIGGTSSMYTVVALGVSQTGRLLLDIYPNKGYIISAGTNTDNIFLHFNNFKVESAAVDGHGILKVALNPVLNESFSGDSMDRLAILNGLYQMKQNDAYGFNLNISNLTGTAETATVVKGSLPAGVELKRFDTYGVHGTPTEDGVYETTVKVSAAGANSEAAVTVWVESAHIHSFDNISTESGGTKFSCSCGNSYKVESSMQAKAAGHKYTVSSYDTSEAGYVKVVKKCSDCGESTEIRFAEAEHKDLDGDLKCDYCGSPVAAKEVVEEVKEAEDTPVEETVEESVPETEEIVETAEATEAPKAKATETKKEQTKKKANITPIIIILLIAAGAGGFFIYKKKNKVTHYTAEMQAEEEAKEKTPYRAPMPVIKKEEPEVELKEEKVSEEITTPKVETVPPAPHPVAKPLPKPDVIEVHTPNDSI